MIYQLSWVSVKRYRCLVISYIQKYVFINTNSKSVTVNYYSHFDKYPAEKATLGAFQIAITHL